jgi:hypothetical protein
MHSSELAVSVSAQTPTNRPPYAGCQMAPAQNDAKPPACPAGKSANTFHTFEHIGENAYFCVECEHSWTVQPGTLPKRPPSR